MKAKILYFIIVSLLSAGVTLAQEEIDTTITPKKPVIFRDKKNKNLRYRKWVGEYKIRTNGWSLGVSYVLSDKKNKVPNYTSFTIFHVGLGYTRAAKEGKSPGLEGRDIKYGKINALYPIELSVGKRKNLGRKAVHNGVEVQWEYRGGLVLGWILPYQISTAYGEIESYNSSTSFAYQDYYNIYGGLGSFRNLSFDNIAIGGIVETNVLFNYDIRKRLILTPLIGGSLSFYTESIPLLWMQKSGPLFAEMHIGVEISRAKIR